MCNGLEISEEKTLILISWVAFCLDLSLDNTKRMKHYVILTCFTIKRWVPILKKIKLHYGTINYCKIVHKISPCNHLDTLICALKWKNLEFVKNPQPSPGCFETKITRASCVRAALQRLNHTCSRTILKGYILGAYPFWSNNLISMDIQRVPALRAFWDLEKTVLHGIRVSGTVGGPLLTRKSQYCRYISQKRW